jgi:DNA-binding beta-propeller fold protein YncE
VIRALAATVVAVLAMCAGPMPASAELAMLPGAAGCTSQPSTRGCEPAPGLIAPRGLAIAGDGRVYVAAEGSHALTSLRRGDDGRLQFAGCVSDDGTDGRFGFDGLCADGDGLRAAVAVAIAPESHWAYVLGRVSSSIVAVRSDGADGPPHSATCLADNGHGRCADAVALGGPRGLAVALDEAHIYVAAGGADAVVSLAVDPGSGALTQLGCVSDNGTDGICADGEALRGATAVTVSPDGRHVYVGARGSSAIGIFARQGDGSLRQTGCVVDQAPPGSCASAFGLRGINDLSVSSDGARVYATAGSSSAVTAFARDSSTGGLHQVACLAASGGPGCTGTYAAGQPTALAVMPSGSLIVAGEEGVAEIAVNPATGALSQRSCIAAFQAENCAASDLVYSLSDVAVAPDGRIHVASSEGNAVLTLAQGPAVARASLGSSSGRTLVPVRCPTGRRMSCRGRLVLKRGRRTLGSAAFSVRSGSTRHVTVRVRVRGRVRALASLRDGRTTSAPVPVVIVGRKHS